MADEMAKSGSCYRFDGRLNGEKVVAATFLDGS